MMLMGFVNFEKLVLNQLKAVSIVFRYVFTWFCLITYLRAVYIIIFNH